MSDIEFKPITGTCRWTRYGLSLKSPHDANHVMCPHFHYCYVCGKPVEVVEPEHTGDTVTIVVEDIPRAIKLPKGWHKVEDGYTQEGDEIYRTGGLVRTAGFYPVEPWSKGVRGTVGVCVGRFYCAIRRD